MLQQVMQDVLSDENVSSFAREWYHALDVHAPLDECRRFLAEAELRMIFPEKTLIGIDDFAAWYAGGRYSDGTEGPGVINIFFDEVHSVLTVSVERTGEEEAVVNVVVGWQASWFVAPEAKSRRTSMNATQQWTVRRSATARNPYGLEITSYNAMAQPFEYAPGFARL
jgi:hypothetical protein